MSAFWISFLESTLRVSAPLVLAALGGLLSERSGVITISLEGFMLFGAFFATATALATGSHVLGFAAGGLAGAVIGALFGLATQSLRANQIVAGTAFNLFAFGFTPFLCKIFYASSAGTPSLTINGSAWVPVGVAAVAAAFVHFALQRSRPGLWIRVGGEKPAALHAAGVSVRAVRVGAASAAGFLAGLGGASLSVYLSSSFAKGMTSGRGFMALAAMVFGAWRPIPTALACLLFGFSDALQVRLQGVLLGGAPVPVQFIQMIPYLVTVVILAGFVGQSRAPAALGDESVVE